MIAEHGGSPRHHSSNGQLFLIIVCAKILNFNHLLNGLGSVWVAGGNWLPTLMYEDWMGS